MKNSKVLTGTIVIVLAGTLLYVFTIGENVPPKVKRAFKDKFPYAQSVKWEHEKAEVWEAKFNLQEIPFSMDFHVNGRWIETEHEIQADQLPQPILNRLRSSFDHYEVEKIEMIERADDIYFEVALKNDSTKKSILMDLNGTIVQQLKSDKEGKGR